MALLRKRKFDEYQDVTSRSSHSKVHAAVAQLSPVKKSKSSRTSYFNGTVTATYAW